MRAAASRPHAALVPPRWPLTRRRQRAARHWSRRALPLRRGRKASRPPHQSRIRCSRALPR
eukprot:3994518-Prymnesium_polylepis.1